MLYGKEKWGPMAWHLLHSFSINENLKISENKKHNYYIFYTSFKYILPCEICGEHYSDIIYNLNPLEKKNITRIYLKKWVFNTHNIVNSIINKPLYSYKKFNKNNYIVNNKDIFFIIKYIYKNFDYQNMSLHKYDQIFNFFINFCILYPIKNIRIKLKKIIKNENFIKIQTPLKFNEWFEKILPTLEIIICYTNTIYSNKKEELEKNLNNEIDINNDI
jgi:hypothetical protein